MIIVKGKDGAKEVKVPEGKREKQKLSDEKILELAEICLAIEKHYGFPCDIEWAAAPEEPKSKITPLRRGSEGQENKKLKIYIVQSRPITTLSAG